MEFETQPTRLDGFQDAQATFRPATRIDAPDDVIARRLGAALARDGVISERALSTFLAFGGAHAPDDVLIEQPLRKKAPAFGVSRIGARSVTARPIGDVGVLSAFRRIFGAQLAKRAATRRPAKWSYRLGPAPWQRAAACALFGAPPLAALISIEAAVATILWIGAVVLSCNAVLWLCAAGAAAMRRAPPPPPKLTSFPRITLLVALYREADVVNPLIRALDALDYPRDRLDIKIVLEEDDEETLVALRSSDMPRGFEIIIAPEGAPRTKPRALNYAADFARGEIIGVYDAEDRPDADQLLKVAAAFAEGGSRTACVQARLGYYNVRENWITRCFELEYAAWFDALLPGLRRVGMPLPLGGTSLFIRRSALEEVGGWDSHNVTEDADLGMALARIGLETALIDSLTLEEASSQPLAWIKQRSRWLKGYLATWLTHMRDPGALWRDLGPRRFIGFNAILLGAVIGYLLMAPLWIVAVAAALGYAPASATLATNAVAATGALVAPSLAAAAALGLRRRGRFRYFGWILTIPAYWLLGVAAAHLAVWELMTAPTRWRKTRHGVGSIAKRKQSAAGEA
ncbi:MAG: glycosyltransferase family 2 protein [Pseudomonadota bacterium]